MLNIGPLELIVILLIALIFVGPKKLPELGRTIGRSLRELRKAQDEVRSTFNLLDEPPRAQRATAARRPAARPRPDEPVEPDRDDVPPAGGGEAAADGPAATPAGDGTGPAAAAGRPVPHATGPPAPRPDGPEGTRNAGSPKGTQGPGDGDADRHDVAG
jgi:TatA/E family protein of Tat protein translocase